MNRSVILELTQWSLLDKITTPNKFFGKTGGDMSLLNTRLLAEFINTVYISQYKNTQKNRTRHYY